MCGRTTHCSRRWPQRLHQQVRAARRRSNMAEAAKEAAAAAGGAIEINEFDKLMAGAFKPKTDSAAEAIKQGVQTLAEQALASAAVVSDDAIKTIQAIIA